MKFMRCMELLCRNIESLACNCPYSWTLYYEPILLRQERERSEGGKNVPTAAKTLLVVSRSGSRSTGTSSPPCSPCGDLWLDEAVWCYCTKESCPQTRLCWAAMGHTQVMTPVQAPRLSVWGFSWEFRASDLEYSLSFGPLDIVFSSSRMVLSYLSLRLNHCFHFFIL